MDQDAAPPGIDAGPGYVAPIVCASVAGNRLKREYIEPTPGATQEYRIIDALHDVECRYQAEGDGLGTCYPVNSAVSSTVFYQDSGCTSALARYPLGGTPRQFTRVIRPSALPCGPPIQEHRLVGAASPVIGGQDIFALDMVGACVPQVAPSGDYYVAGPLLLSADFVNATIEPFSASTRLSGLVHVGDDGSEMCAPNLPKVDSSLSQSCVNRLDAAGETRCIPAGGVSETFFADEVCEGVTTVVAVDACEQTPPGYVIEETSDSCGLVTRTATAVLAEEVTVRYRLAGNNCQLINPDTNTYFKVGALAADSDFAPLAPETEAIEGRLQRMLISSADRFAEFSNLWFDTKLDTPCTFSNASDGSLRCLPPALSSTILFTDALCLNAVTTFALQQECQLEPKFMAKAGPMGTRIFAATPFLETVYQLQGLTCEEVTVGVYQESFEHAAASFQLGEILLQ